MTPSDFEAQAREILNSLNNALVNSGISIQTHNAQEDIEGDYIDIENAMSKALSALTTLHEAAVREAQVEVLGELQTRGHMAQRASVPNTDNKLVFDRADWVSIQVPIFYCYASTIPDMMSQLRTPHRSKVKGDI